MNVIDILSFFMILIFSGVLEAILMNEFFKNSTNIKEVEGETKWKRPLTRGENGKS